MSEFENIFETPVLQYLRLKKSFLNKFMDVSAWGEQGSKERIVALAKLLQYLNETRDLAAFHPNVLGEQVCLDNKKLILERILPMPMKLYEEVLWHVVQDEEALKQSNEDILGRIENFLIRKQRSCLLILESEVWSEVHNYDSYRKPAEELLTISKQKVLDTSSRPKDMKMVTAKLRRLRFQLYFKAKTENNVGNEISEYKEEVKHFIGRFRKFLSKQVITIWNNKVKTTTKDVENILLKNKFCETDQNTPLAVETLEQDIDNADVLGKFPDVPNDVDLDIEERLLKLTFFRQVWEDKKNDDKFEEFEEELPSDFTVEMEEDFSNSEKGKDTIIKNDEVEDILHPATKKEDEEYLEDSTELNQINFNTWYYQKIAALKHPEGNSFQLADKTKSSVEATTKVKEEGVRVEVHHTYQHSQHHAEAAQVIGAQGGGEGNNDPVKPYQVGLVRLEVVLVLIMTVMNLLHLKSFKFSHSPVYSSTPTATDPPKIFESVMGWFSGWKSEFSHLLGCSRKEDIKIKGVEKVDWDWADKSLLRDYSWY